MVRGGIRGREMEDLGCRPKLEDLPAVRQKWVIFWSPPIPTFTGSIQSRNTALWDENQYLTICSTFETYIIETWIKWEQAPSGEWNVWTGWLNSEHFQNETKERDYFCCLSSVPSVLHTPTMTCQMNTEQTLLLQTSFSTPLRNIFAKGNAWKMTK